jgi:hypothetical protein
MKLGIKNDDRNSSWSERRKENRNFLNLFCEQDSKQIYEKD